MAIYAGSLTTISADGTAIGQVVSVDVSGYSREAVDTTHLGDVVKTYRQSTQLDGGTVDITYNYDPADSEQGLLRDRVLDGGADIAFLITYPDTSTDGFTGIPTNWQPSNIANEDTSNLQAQVTIQIDGDVVHTGA